MKKQDADFVKSNMSHVTGQNRIIALLATSTLKGYR